MLLAKKRYVGFSYESPGQAAPAFDAKGIETVRRDTCGAVAKMMERSIRILFATKDLSQARNAVCLLSLITGTQICAACAWSYCRMRQAASAVTGSLVTSHAWSAMQVKDYVMRQWSKILAGRVSLADFVFAKEVRSLALVLDLLAMLLAAHWPCS